MQELQVIFLQGEVLVAGVDGGVEVMLVGGRGGPEDVVVVGEEGEEDTEEEACCCIPISVLNKVYRANVGSLTAYDEEGRERRGAADSHGWLACSPEDGVAEGRAVSQYSPTCLPAR